MTLLKSLVVCLVLANAGYYLWARGIARSASASLPPAPTSTLKLASEAGGTGRVSGNEAAGTVLTGVSGAVGVGVGGAGAGAGAGSVGAGAAGAANEEGPSPVAAGRSGPASAASGGSESTASVPLLTNVKRCVTVGPFRDVSEAARAASTLRAGHYDPRQRVAEGDVWAGVWVYLPIPEARGAAEQMLAKLRGAGIDDALEMPGPYEGSVISLGLFSEPKRAQARVVQAQSLGLNPGIADRKRTGNVYWIDVDLKPTDGLLNPSDLQGEAGRIVRLEVKGCPSVAGTVS